MHGRRLKSLARDCSKTTRHSIIPSPRVPFGVGLLAGLTLVSAAAHATSNYVNIETADDYSYYSSQTGQCVGTDCHVHDIQCNEEGDGFWGGIVSGGSPFFMSSVNYQDSDTWDEDFIDIDVYSPIGDDQDTFDQPQSAIGFTCLHGKCKDDTMITCNSGADCPSGDVCVNTPPSLYTSHCANVVTKYLVTSTPSYENGNLVEYSNNISKWGEGTQTWANAGNVGGDNFVVMVNSCGLRAPFWQELWPVFAGVHGVAGIMPITINDGPPGRLLKGMADVDNWSSRGEMLAAFMYNNLDDILPDAWFETMDSGPDDSGSGCPNFDSNFTAGGGGGILGCGVYYVAATDSTQASALFHIETETWNDLPNDSYDSGGNTWHYLSYHCNYDCYTYPFTK